jgi:hypothetical protein
MLAPRCIGFIFLFLHSFFSLHTSCSRCRNSSLHSFILVFLCSFFQHALLTMVDVDFFLHSFHFAFFISFSLVHTSCIFYYWLFIAFFSTINFSSYAATLLFQCISILHATKSISCPSTWLFLAFSFISYFNSFVVCCSIVQVFFLVHFCDDFFLYFFILPLVLGHHGISHIAIAFVFFITPDVCTYFCPFFFPLLAFPLLFQVSFVIFKILLLFHVYKCFFSMFLFCFCFVDFLCKFLCLQF